MPSIPSPGLPDAAPLRVLLWGMYDTSKPRIRVLSRGMAEAGIELHTIHAGLWESIEDKSQVRGWATWLRLARRALACWPRLAWKLCTAPRTDVILVSYPGLVDIWFATLVGACRRIPVAFDVFISLYDTVVCDRGLMRKGSIPARILHSIEGAAIRAAAIPFMDTATHARRIEHLFGLPQGAVGDVWVGAEVDAFPSKSRSAARGRPLRALFYGQFIPLHGIDTIVEAARLLCDHDIDWLIVGRGQESARIDALLAAQPLPRVTRIPWLDYSSLARHIEEADVCLGIFGTSDKAASVIPNKVFQIISAGRPLITRDSPAIRELFDGTSTCVSLVPPADPRALADAVLSFASFREPFEAPPCHVGLAPTISARAIGERFEMLIRLHLSVTDHSI